MNTATEDQDGDVTQVNTHSAVLRGTDVTPSNLECSQADQGGDVTPSNLEGYQFDQDDVTPEQTRRAEIWNMPTVDRMAKAAVDKLKSLIVRRKADAEAELKLKEYELEIVQHYASRKERFEKKRAELKELERLITERSAPHDVHFWTMCKRLSSDYSKLDETFRALALHSAVRTYGADVLAKVIEIDLVPEQKSFESFVAEHRELLRRHGVIPA